MKKVFAVFLAVCIMASLGISAFADAADYPWGASGNVIENVVIGDGLVNVPAAPFAGMKNITSVTLPASVVNIEGDAFGDSGIAEVRTVGDPEVLEGVKAFENAKITQISQDEFDAAVKEITDNATEVGEKGAYILSGTSLLVRLIEKRTVPAASFWLYGDEGSAGGTSESGSLSNEVFDELGRLVSGTYYYSDVTIHVENTYNSDDPNDNDYSGTQKITWEEPSGAHGTQTTTYNENGIPTERTSTSEGPDGSSSQSVTKYNEDGNPTERTSTWTNPDGSTGENTAKYEYNDNGTIAKETQTWNNSYGSGESTRTFDENGNVTEETESWKNADGSSGTYTEKFDENGNTSERSNSWENADGSSGTSTQKFDENGNLTEDFVSNKDKDGNTFETKREFQYNGDATNRKVTVTDSDGNENTYWETKDENGTWVPDDSIRSPE